MASSITHISRKDLKAPDQFQQTADEALNFFDQHRNWVIAGAVGIVVLLAVIVGWQSFKSNQNATAGRMFSNAMTFYQTEKYREAGAEFAKVQTYRWSHFANLAHLYQANSLLALGELDEAHAAAQRFVSGSRSDSLYKQMGLVTLGVVAEKKNDCKTAVDRYDEAARISGAYKETAQLGKARCLEQMGDLNGAVTAYKDYQKDASGTPISLKISELEAKLAEKTVSK